MKNLAAAFVKAKKAFAPALKANTNPHFKSKYADLASCIEAVDDALLSNGIVMYQETFESDDGVTVETVLLHESGEMLRCGKLHMPAQKSDPQGFMSALTYCRRGSLMAACGIAPEDDDGNAASKPRTAPAFNADKAVDELSASVDLEALKAVFAKHYTMADAAQKKNLKATYDAIKSGFEEMANA